jgi:hypothetical protein
VLPESRGSWLLAPLVRLCFFSSSLAFSDLDFGFLVGRAVQGQAGQASLWLGAEE